jgi:hypothetical protein
VFVEEGEHGGLAVRTLDNHPSPLYAGAT